MYLLACMNLFSKSWHDVSTPFAFYILRKCTIIRLDRGDSSMSLS